MTYQPTPQQLAEFDQQLAEINHNITLLIDVYNSGRQKFELPLAIIGLQQTILHQAHHDPHALSEYLAVTIHRIAQLENGIKTVLNTPPTDTHSPASNSEQPPPTADPYP